MSLSVSAWQGYWEEDIPAKLGCTNISFQQEELPAHRQEFPHLSLSLAFFSAFPLHTLSNTASRLLPPLSLPPQGFTHTHTKPHLSRYAAYTCFMLLSLSLSSTFSTFSPPASSPKRIYRYSIHTQGTYSPLKQQMCDNRWPHSHQRWQKTPSVHQNINMVITSMCAQALAI